MGVFKKNGNWWIDFYDADRRRRRKKVGTSKTLAKQALADALNKVASGERLGPSDIGARSCHNVTPLNVGAAGELMVSTNLIVHGFNVFRAITPNAFCDLIVEKDSRLFRVEVKVARRPVRGMADKETDVLAVVRGKEIAYVDPKTLKHIEGWLPEKKEEDNEEGTRNL